MTLCDAGPLFALVDDRQAAHAACLATLPSLSVPLVTTWPCFTEAMYFAYKAGGFPLQELLWEYVESGILHFHDLAVSEQENMRVLMARYRDAPMDMADASLVAAAETLETRRVFTLDRHFRAYRVGKAAFEVVP